MEHFLVPAHGVQSNLSDAISELEMHAQNGFLAGALPRTPRTAIGDFTADPLAGLMEGRRWTGTHFAIVYKSIYGPVLLMSTILSAVG